MTTLKLQERRQSAIGHEEIRSDSDLGRQEPRARMVQKTGSSGSEAADFFSVVPLDARLQVLGFVVRNRSAGVAYEDLVSYAQTSSQAQLDLSAFHHLAQDFSLSLLSTRTLTCRAWAQASGAGARKLREFEEYIFSAGHIHNAVYADLAYQKDEPSMAVRATEIFFPATAAAAGPQAIRSLLKAGPLQYLHFRLGYTSADMAGNEERAVATLEALIQCSQDLLANGKQPPTIFLDSLHLDAHMLVQQLANAATCPPVAGFSFRAKAKHAGELYPVGMRGAWVGNLSKFNQVRHLQFDGFSADVVLDALYGWLQKNKSLQELHLSCDYLTDAALNLLSSVLATHQQLRLLRLEGYAQQSFSKSTQNSLAILLRRKPDLRLVLGRQLAEGNPLAAFPKQVICDHYPVAARSMPEVWGWGEAWHVAEA